MVHVLLKFVPNLVVLGLGVALLVWSVHVHQTNPLGDIKCCASGNHDGEETYLVNGTCYMKKTWSTVTGNRYNGYTYHGHTKTSIIDSSIQHAFPFIDLTVGGLLMSISLILVALIPPRMILREYETSDPKGLLVTAVITIGGIAFVLGSAFSFSTLMIFTRNCKDGSEAAITKIYHHNQNTLAFIVVTATPALLVCALIGGFVLFFVLWLVGEFLLWIWDISKGCLCQGYCIQCCRAYVNSWLDDEKEDTTPMAPLDQDDKALCSVDVDDGFIEEEPLSET